MTPRPWKPDIELQGALARGELALATTLAAEVAEDRGRPIDLAAALDFLPVVAGQLPDRYDRWASRWLSRWLGETPRPTIVVAAELAASLADLPADPAAVEKVRAVLPTPGVR